MADLTNVETTLGEFTGSAMAAQATTEKVLKLAQQDGESQLEAKLQQMHAGRDRNALHGALRIVEGQEDADPGRGADDQGHGRGVMKTSLDEESDSLDGFAFLMIAEAGEVGTGRYSRP
jgi:hypothetical protein